MARRFSSPRVPRRSAEVTALAFDFVCAPTMTFSSTVIPGHSARFWNVRKMPTREMVEARVDSRSRPSNVMRPSVGL